MIKPYYDHAGITIYLCDCLEILPELEPVDLVLTDPPYGVTQNKWDKIEITKSAFDLLFPCNLVCTCQNPSSAELITRYIKYFKWSDIWHKSQAVGFLNAKIMPLREHEDILIFSNGTMPYSPQIRKKGSKNIRPHGDTAASSNYGKFNKHRKRTIALNETYPRSVFYCENSQNGNHSNEKPVKLMDYLIKTYAQGTILDPFMGSGTTLVAAKELGRRAIGIEIEQRYCDIAIRRLAQEVLPFEQNKESREVNNDVTLG